MNKTKRILIIDDDMMVAKLLDDFLTGEGFEVAKFTLAEEGYESALKQPPDLIILDVNLPDATGFQICGRFRQTARTTAIPIIMVSGAARFPNQQAIGKSLGANDYLLKPFNVTDVGTKVRSLLKLAENTNGTSIIPDAGTEVSNASNPSVSENMRVLSLSEEASEGPTAQEPPATLPPAKLKEPEPETDAPVRQNGHVAIPIPQLESSLPAWEPLTPKTAPSEEVSLPPPTAPPAVAASARVPEPVRIPSPQQPHVILSSVPTWPLAGCLFMAQVILSLITVWAAKDRAVNPITTATYVAGGWALLLGLLTFGSALLRIPLLASSAVRIIGLSAIPLVLKSIAALLGAFIPALAALQTLRDANHVIPDKLFWLRPLDIFETAAMIMMGFALRRETRAPAVKCAVVAAIAALVWCLTNRGYFLPF